MAFTFTNDPQNNQIDEIRSLSGDTVQSDISLTDEQIAYLIVTVGSGIVGAVAAASAIAANAAKRADEVNGEIQVKWSQRAKSYLAISKNLSDSLNGSDGSVIGSPYVGGVYISDISINNSNVNRVSQKFNMGGMDNNY